MVGNGVPNKGQSGVNKNKGPASLPKEDAYGTKSVLTCRGPSKLMPKGLANDPFKPLFPPPQVTDKRERDCNGVQTMGPKSEAIKGMVPVPLNGVANGGYVLPSGSADLPQTKDADEPVYSISKVTDKTEKDGNGVPTMGPKCEAIKGSVPVPSNGVGSDMLLSGLVDLLKTKNKDEPVDSASKVTDKSERDGNGVPTVGPKSGAIKGLVPVPVNGVSDRRDVLPSVPIVARYKRRKTPVKGDRPNKDAMLEPFFKRRRVPARCRPELYDPFENYRLSASKVTHETERAGNGVPTMGPKGEAMKGSVPVPLNGVANGDYVLPSGRVNLPKTNNTNQPVDSTIKVTDKTIKEPLDKVLDSSSSDQGGRIRLDSGAPMNGSDECSHMKCRKFVLERMHQSLTNREGGLQECILKALSCTNTVKTSHHCGEEGHMKFHKAQYTSKGNGDALPNGASNKVDNCTNTELCKRALFDILLSKKFSELCNLLFKTFYEVKADHILDVNVINSRMKEGAYESSPSLFLSDIQEVWTKLQNVGNEMVTLAKSLSDESRSNCEKLKMGDLENSTPRDDKVEVVLQEPGMINEPRETEACGMYRICMCKHCGQKADGRDCLVCDSCEDMFHVSCIKPPVEDIPLKSWYCTNCISKGIESPHENCVICERLNAAPSPPTVGGDEVLTNEDELDEASPKSRGGRKLATCRICRSEIKNGEKFRTCGHIYCIFKYFHDRCLTKKQLGTYGSCWFCPSCLCRTCLTDKDDKNIILCDGCDGAYHLYCMTPPRLKIPRGRWYCVKCDVKIQSIRKAKAAYQRMQNNLNARDGEGKGEDKLKKVEMREDVLDKSAGVDMLLSAAKTLNYQESMAALKEKPK